MSLSDRYTVLLDKCANSLTTWKTLIDEHLEDPNKAAELQKIDSITKEYCRIDDNHQRSEKALALLKESVSDHRENQSIDDLFQKLLAEQDVHEPTEHELWRQLFANDMSIQEVVPKKKKDKTEYETVDDSLMCSSSFSAPVDPITKVVIRKPMRNLKCKHIYDSQSIYDYIRQSKSKAKCPYVGCQNNRLRPTDLVADDRLEQQISQHLASQESQSSDSESDDTDDWLVFNVIIKMTSFYLFFLFK